MSTRIIENIFQDFLSDEGKLAEQTRIHNKAVDDLIALVLADSELFAVAQHYGATPEKLRKVYGELERHVGMWARGHWVPASSLTFVFTLDYILRHPSFEITERVGACLWRYFRESESRSID